MKVLLALIGCYRKYIDSYIDEDQDGIFLERDCDDDDDTVGSADPNRPYYRDADQDGYGDPNTATVACPQDLEPSFTWVTNGLDCNDLSASVGAAPTWFVDQDEDGFGEAGTTEHVNSCAQPDGFAATDDDCDDSDPTVYPGAAAIYNDDIIQDCVDRENETYNEGQHTEESLESSVFELSGTSGSEFGSAVVVGDVNGDSLDDLLVSAPSFDSENRNAGAVWILHGPVDEDVSLNDAVQITGGEASVNLGSAMALVPDQNEDGLSELLMAGDLYGSGLGIVYYLESPFTTQDLTGSAGWITGSSSAYLGSQMQTVGDTDSDGRTEVAVSSIQGEGRVFVYELPWEGQEDRATYQALVRGNADGDQAGQALSGQMDLNGDGIHDLAIGASRGGQDRAGEVGVVQGPLNQSINLSDADWFFQGTESRAYVGASVALVPDQNEDGLSDLVIGATGAQDADAQDVGAVYLVLGGEAQTQDLADGAEAIWYGDQEGDRLGASVSAAGDLDNNGFEDLIFGAPNAGGNDAGASYLVYNDDGSFSGVRTLELEVAYRGGSASSYEGSLVSGLFDLNGDEFDDVISASSDNDSVSLIFGQSY